ncbi:MAG: ferrous iron transporter B [Planctomycetes bacterium]|nr:ferrous iron transporter B [Planctomycetota bacterium]
MSPSPPVTRFALLGNPNTGKTTLFNRLSGLRAKTGNYPGITQDARRAEFRANGTRFEIIDLPGAYSLHIDTPESIFDKKLLGGDAGVPPEPDGILLIVDAGNLARNLVLVAEALTFRKPAVLLLNMIDLAEAAGLAIDRAGLERRLGIPVIAGNARTGAGIDRLADALARAQPCAAPLEFADHAARSAWADRLAEEFGRRVPGAGSRRERLTDRLDKFVTHPVLGALCFIAVMSALFVVIFRVAEWPMSAIETIFASAGAWLARVLPPGAAADLVAGGVVSGIAGTVVFLPQICLLFFLLSLLEDTGYLARAAFVANRLLRRFGLPGQAFVPLLSSHACAIPGILCTRLIPDRRDRIATILVAPFMSCSARLPVYVLLIGLLFADNALAAGVAFASCYLLGAAAALASALVARRTILRGKSPPMVLELPSYKVPSLRTALVTMFERGWLFLRNAGTAILAICVVMWWLSTYPIAERSAAVAAMHAEAEALAAAAPEEAAELRRAAALAESKDALAHSFAGRLGHAVEPALAPLGFDWQIDIAVLTSFLAREVFVSSMAVILGTGAEAAAEGDSGILGAVGKARREDGSPLFTWATAASLLVFYVLAMQCLPTLAVTRRETGAWKWAALQFGYMTALAYLAALATFQGLRWFGVE